MLKMNAGERLHASIFLPQSGAFEPGLAVIGPGIVNKGALPDFVEIPQGYGYIAVEGAKHEREYEPFTPAAYYQTCRVDFTLNQSGTYYIAVFEAHHAGDFGLAIGHVESFTIIEWLMVPISVINVHLWEGQSPFVIFGPLIMTVFLVPAGLYIAKRRNMRIPSTISFGLVTVAASLSVGTAMMTALQMSMALSVSSGPSVAGGLVTALFIAIPLVIGLIMLMMAVSDKWTRIARIKLIILGIVGLTFWAGLLVGPILAIVTATMPQKVQRRDVRAWKWTD